MSYWRRFKRWSDDTFELGWPAVIVALVLGGGLVLAAVLR